MLMQVTSLSKWDSLVGEEGLLKPSERPVVLNRSTFQSCPRLPNFVQFYPLLSDCQQKPLPSEGPVVIDFLPKLTIAKIK